MNKEDALKSFYNAIDHVDFKKIRNVMLLLKWKWFTEDGHYHIPSISELKIGCRELFNILIEEEYDHLYSGGFKISVEEKSSLVEIEFIIENKIGWYD